MICNSCGRAFHAVNVNVIADPGTLERTIVGDQLVITTAAIERGVSYF